MTKTTTARIDTELIDRLLKDYQKPEAILAEDGLLKQFTKALLERAMQVELTEHLGYERHDSAGDNSGNSRNGTSQKTLKGFPEAIETVFPQTQVQLCIVHMVRHSLNFVGYQQRKEVATDLQKIYRAASRDEAELRLSAFAEKWKVGGEVSDHQPVVATQLGTLDAVSRLPGRNLAGQLHDQRCRKRQYVAQKDYQESWFVPDR